MWQQWAGPRLAYLAEAGTWRNIYLTGAQELRHGVTVLPPQRFSLDLIRATPTEMMLDFAAVRVNPEKAAGKRIVLNVVLTDAEEKHLITVENGVLIHEARIFDDRADATVTMKRDDMLQTMFAGVPVGLKTTIGAIKVDGNGASYGELVGLIDPVNANFNVVTP
ncbi:MAG TPA: alkyl sulfatase C-terminal domain-containing protein [Polyangiaceae bacterium]|nr:alkyl sulfatase C-terminal domain-containing protein [Polyangiaceae bacterium]